MRELSDALKLHPYHQSIIDANEVAGRPYFHQLTPEGARELLRAGVAAAPKPTDLPNLGCVEDRTIDGPVGPITVRIYRPEGAPLGTCVYFHGGGWVIGDLDMADATCRRLTGQSQCTIISVDYRMAPEYPYPHPLNDCWAAVLWAAQAFPGPLLVAGESAGGNLAAACAIRARDAGGPLLAGQLLAYPVTDHDFSTPSYRQIGERNWLLSTKDMRWFWDHYCPQSVDRSAPEISPQKLKSTRGLAPAMIVLGEYDPLRSEGLAYAAHLADGGVPVEMRCDTAMIHGYLAAASAIPVAAAALADAAQWMWVRVTAS
jgi:acetyl esterase